MIPLVLCLAQTPDSKAPPRTIEIGSVTTETLPLRLEGKRNLATEAFQLDVRGPGTITVTAESLDFNVWVSVEDAKSGAQTKEGGLGPYTDAWLIQEATEATTWTLRVGAEDSRGGEFVLSVLEGRVDPPTGPVEWTLATIARFEAGAARADQRGDADRAMWCLGQACQFAYGLEDLARARTFGEKLLGLAERSHHQREIVRGQAYLGAIHRKCGEWERAEERLGGAVVPLGEMLAAAADPDEQRKISDLQWFLYDNLGELRKATRGAGESIEYFRKFVEAASRAGRPNIEATAWGKLGTALAETGNLPEARQALDRSLEMARRLGKSDIVGNALLESARFHSRTGEPAQARKLCQEALVLSLAPPLRIWILGTLSEACSNLGRYEEALAALSSLEGLDGEFGGGQQAIPILVTQAAIGAQLGEPEAALRSLEQALELQETSGDRRHRIDILVNLGVVLTRLSSFDEARRRYDQALETCRDSGDEAREARILLDLGQLHEKRCAYGEELEALERAQEIAERVGNKAIAATARGGRGSALYHMDRMAEAKELALPAARELEELEEWEFALDMRDTLARIALKESDLPALEKTLATAERMLEQGAEDRLETFARAGLRSRLADWGCITQDFFALRAHAAPADSEARNSIVAEGWEKAGRWKGRVLLERMKRGEPGSAPTSPSVHARSALIEYVEGLDKLFAYVVLPGGGTHLLDLGNSASIQDRARRYAGLLALGAVDALTGTSEGIQLYEELVSPVVPLLPTDTKTLVIVPTPGLSVLPFEALVRPPRPTETGKKESEPLRYLIDDWCIVFAPSSPVLAELQRRGPTGRAQRFLIAGDPVYRFEAEESDDSLKIAAARRSDLLPDFDRLRKSREEVLEITRLLLVRDSGIKPDDMAKLLAIPDKRSASMSTSHFDLYLGAEATAGLLRGELSGYTDLHLAAHGHIDPDDPRRSGLVLSYEPSTEGLFPLADVLGLHLDADLVVLSACDTARGPVVRGEGVHSLVYGFLQAGARSAIATLWKIEDREGAEIMKEFYSLRFDSKLHPAEALRQAKLHFRHSRESRGERPAYKLEGPSSHAANPYFWASFVFVGAPPE